MDETVDFEAKWPRRLSYPGPQAAEGYRSNFRLSKERFAEIMSFVEQL